MSAEEKEDKLTSSPNKTEKYKPPVLIEYGPIDRHTGAGSGIRGEQGSRKQRKKKS